MAERLYMTALSPTMESGQIVKWHKKEGDEIHSGDILCEVETDKTVMEMEAVNEGTLLKITLPEGGKAKVGETIGIIGKKGEDISSLLGEESVKETITVDAESSSRNENKTFILKDTIVDDSHSSIKASPLARKLAQINNLDLRRISGSGPNGRIIKEDVEKALIREKAIMKKDHGHLVYTTSSDEKIPISEKRKIIADRLSQSKFTAPHYYLRVSINMDAVIKARSKLNKQLHDKISLNAFFIKFAAKAINRFPIINATWEGEFIRRHKTIDIGLAVAQKDGLITPVVRNISHKGILAIHEELTDLIQRARQGNLSPEEYSGATFTISSLGNFGIEEFTAIINPPGSAIMAMGEITQKPIVTESEEIRISSIMKVTLSCDHRVIDGAVGAQFLKSFKDMLENPIEVLY